MVRNSYTAAAIEVAREIASKRGMAFIDRRENSSVPEFTMWGFKDDRVVSFRCFLFYDYIAVRRTLGLRVRGEGIDTKASFAWPGDREPEVKIEKYFSDGAFDPKKFADFVESGIQQMEVAEIKGNTTEILLFGMLPEEWRNSGMRRLPVIKSLSAEPN